MLHPLALPFTYQVPATVLKNIILFFRFERPDVVLNRETIILNVHSLLVRKGSDFFSDRKMWELYGGRSDLTEHLDKAVSLIFKFFPELVDAPNTLKFLNTFGD